jgi:RHS repeat-associated protein
MADQQQHQPGAQGQGKQPAPHALSQYSVQPQQNAGAEDSPYFKSAAPAISMPKGGGAIKGIDEKFSVNAVNGTAGLEIPLPLTPGRGGFTPALSISYNSGGGNSEFGLGWGLSLPAIQRKTDRELPLYDDAQESDIFLLAGAEDLIPVLDAAGNREILYKNGYTIKRYRPRIEGLFARIEHISRNGEGQSWWRVTTKENITTYYGLRKASRITDPAYAHRIFKWLPDMVTDHKGNVQLYSYKAENTDNVPDLIYERNRKNGLQPIANTYLKRVYYGNRTPYFITPDENDVLFPELPDTQWLFEAVLDYGEHPTNDYEEQEDWSYRQDAFSDFHAGFEIRTYRKCRKVLLFHHFDELNNGQPTLVRSLDLQYEADGAMEAVETDYITQAKVTVYRSDGSGGYQSRSMPAMKLKYSKLKWNTKITKVAKEDFTGAPQGLTGPYQWMDFEGEGISGIFTEQAKGWYYKNNLGKGHFAPPKRIAEKPSFAGMGQSLQWQDLDADGRRQVVDNAVAKGFWELDGPDAFTQYDKEWLPFKAFEKVVNIDWNSPFTQMLDLNGDGRADVLITEDRAWTWWQNEGKKGFAPGGKAPVYTDEEKGPVLLLRDAVQSIFLADMNGDGMTDLVRIRNGEVCYWPNMGYGQFGAKVAMQGAPYFDAPERFNPQYLMLADISGTGAADIIYTGRNKCTAWINLSGNAFADAFDINPLPGTDAYSKLTVVDFLGNGTGCLVWSSPLPMHADAPLQYIDLMGGHKPHLLQKYYNGTGKSVWLQYKSSVRYYLEDKLKGIRWATRLPFPVHCVRKITTYDIVSRSRFAQEYRYRHGYYDHEEREFRGFGYVETIDTDSVSIRGGNNELDGLYQHPVLTKTWYHTGAWIREHSLIDTFKQEYFHFEGWDDLVQIAALPTGLNAQELREAHRALKGSALRQEVYALDDSTKRDIPYAVTATAYLVKKIQGTPAPVQGWKARKHASFINMQEQSVAYGCERNPDDPRILHELVLDTDEYGNVLQSATVAYPRKEIPVHLPDKVKEAQEKMHITAAENRLTNDAIDDAALAYYRLRTGFEQKSYELKTDAPTATLYTVQELYDALSSATETDYTAMPVNTGEKRVLAHSLALFYNDDADTALPEGMIESLGLPYESYTLAFTKHLLDACYQGRVDGVMTESGGYRMLAAHPARLWLPSGVTLFTDPKDKFYTPERYTDPWGNPTDITFWNDYWLLPESTHDAKGNVSSVLDYEWRTLQPLRMQDMNDNITGMLYDILGFPVAMAVKGKDDGTEGDTLDGIDPDTAADQLLQEAFWADPQANAEALLQGATWRCVYELDSLPAGVAMIGREQHHYPLSPDPVKTLLQFSYSDGFGREIMQKVQCEPTSSNDKRKWIGTGRTIYNNKGNPVMQYEPYFSDTHRCDTAEQAAMQGVSPCLFYDALGRNYKTELPDGTFTLNKWTAWEQEVWDNNDTVLQSAWYWAREGGAMGPEEQDAAAKAAAHADTPTIIHTDTLARGFYTIQNDGINPLIHSHEILDVQGNRLAVVDGRGLTPLQYRYNMLQAPVWQLSMDKGTIATPDNNIERTFTDVAGQAFYIWDADDRMFEYLYDELRRILQKKVTESSVTRMLEVYEYGEGVVDDKLRNVRGKAFNIYDGAGLVAMPEYDFKGNPLLQQRTYTENVTVHPDWTTISGVILETDTYRTEYVYDALNRAVNIDTPDEATTSHTYDKGGLLQSVMVDNVHSLDTDIVSNIEYDAQGQRTKVQYENGTTTTYTYDAFTFRVRRIRTTRHSDNKELQDLRYWYDPVGNITLQKDEAQQPVYFDGTVALPHNDYTYDALYRLIQAAGRELAGNNNTPNYNDSSRIGITPIPIAGADTAKMRRYIQYYEYDAVGNFIEMRHTVTGGGAGNWTRTYNTASDSNRMLSSTASSVTETYTYDNRGNITGGMHHLNAGAQSMHYNADNRLEQVIIDSKLIAYYQYDANGQRVRKTLVNTSAGKTEVRKYIGEWEVFRKFDNSSLATELERETLHIGDDTGRIALIDTRTVGSGAEPAQLLRYQYSNHLQSATLELDDAGAVISYEEYYPYGSTSFQSGRSGAEVSLKRYRYCAAERDEESGLYYFGARYYIPWLCRWNAIDPINSENYNLQKGYGLEKNKERQFLELTASSYEYCYDNPVRFSDPLGEQTNPLKYETQVPSSVDKLRVYRVEMELEIAVAHVYKVNKKTGKAEEIDVEGIKKSLSKGNLKMLDKGGFFIYREGRLSITSEKTITEINNPSKADDLNRFAIEKLQTDAKKFNGQFPNNYYVDFSKSVIQEGIKLFGADKGVDMAHKYFAVENLPKAKSVLQLYESIVPNNEDSHFDKVQHFIASAAYQYKYGGLYTNAVQYGKEIFKDEIPSWFSDDKGFDTEDMKANNLGEVYGKDLYKKYHPIRHYFRNLD